MAGRSTLLPSEKQIETLILQWLNMHPKVWARKVNTTGVWDPTKKKFRKNVGYAEIGISDIEIKVFYKPWGRFGVIEVKTEKKAKEFIRKYGYPCTPDQQAYIEKTVRYGGFGGVAWTLDMAIEICEGHI